MSITVLGPSDTPSSQPRPIAETSRQRADQFLRGLDARKQAWTRVPTARRAELLRGCIDGVLSIAERWVETACGAKRVALDSTAAGEEWISGPMVTVRYLRLLAESLEQGGKPSVELRDGIDGHRIASVFPRTAYERVLYPGVNAEVWIEPERPATQGMLYRDKQAGRGPGGRVALVLGAGNVASIAPSDVLQKLFVEDQVCLLKMNPVNEYLGPLLHRALRELIDEGVLEIVYGGAGIGQYLCEHPLVESIHLTGSDRTFDAIVWGSDPEERRRRKAARTPRLDKPFSAELGCVTPVLVVPGRWTSNQIEFQARNVASMVTHNASFNCNAAKLLVVPSGWYLRDSFLDALREALSRIPSRHAYYPGALQRHQAFLDRYDHAELLSPAAPGAVPWTLIPGVPADGDEPALSTEAFCGILAEVGLETGSTGDPAAFLDRAVPFVNEQVWGTLSCCMLVSEDAEKKLDRGLAPALADLRYGGIGVNIWPGVLFGLGTPTWGAYPGHTREAIGSGVGIVHNALLIDHPVKSVARGPFVMGFPKPPWFADHRNLPAVGRKVAHFEADPSMARLAGLGLSALLG